MQWEVSQGFYLLVLLEHFGRVFAVEFASTRDCTRILGTLGRRCILQYGLGIEQSYLMERPPPRELNQELTGAFESRALSPDRVQFVVGQ